MKNYIHRIATYTALVLISSLPFSLEVLADSEKERSLYPSAANAEKNLLISNKRKALEEGNR